MVKLNTEAGRPLPEEPRFPMGRVVATRGAMDTLSEDEMLGALGRHERGDWGDLPTEDRALNEQNLEQGVGRLFSCYRDSGEMFYVITESDRSVTTVLLVDEY